MRIGNREFKPTLAGTLATLALLPVLLSLGFWQLRRGEEKQALIDRLQAGASTTQNVTAENVEQLPLFQRVVARGRYDPTRQILLDNMWSSKRETENKVPTSPRPGVNVWTPLILEDSHILLVNRGWLPFGRTRTELPNIAVNAETRSVRGLISHVPQPGLRISNDMHATSWPRLLNYPTVAELRALYGDELLPRILLLDAAEPDGYEREWHARYNFEEFGPDRNVGYAVQWFGLALALLAIYFIVSFKTPPSKLT